MLILQRITRFVTSHPWASILVALAAGLGLRLAIILAQLKPGQFQPGRLGINILLIAVLLGGAVAAARHKPRTTAKNRPLSPNHRAGNYGSVLGLLVLAPWVGEFLLGNIPLSGIVALPFLMLLYGAGAVLIREITRRSHRGWPTIIWLATAYGLIEAGLVDQSLFNLGSFDELSFLAATHIPALGINVYNTFTFVAGHVIWSMCVPIAFVELLTPATRTNPWLTQRGLWIVGGIYLIGCAVVWAFVYSDEKFTATPGQLAAAAAFAVLCAWAAFALCPPLKRHTVKTTGWSPTPWQLGIGTLVASSLFFAKPENWLGVGMGVVLAIAAIRLIRAWTNRQGWNITHQFAMAAGALLTYAWGGFMLTNIFRPSDSVAWAGNVLFALGAIALVGITGYRVRSADTRRSSPITQG